VTRYKSIIKSKLNNKQTINLIVNSLIDKA
jgi:hypothetical protein